MNIKTDSENNLLSLCEDILLLKEKRELYWFLKDLCTEKEIQDMCERWNICKILSKNQYSYRDINKITKSSLVTIGRVAKYLREEKNLGYINLLNKITKRNFIKRAKEKITQDVIDFYNENGVIFISNLLNEEELKWLELGIEFNLKNLSNRSKVASQESDKGLFVEDFCTWQNNDFYKKIIFNSIIPYVIALLTQSKKIQLYHDHLLVKEPFTQAITPWHQDQPYYNIDGSENCSIWIPIDNVSKESTLEFIAGSHKGPWYLPLTFAEKKDQWFPKNSLPELESDAKIRKKNRILSWEMKPGDVVIFNMLTVHGSNGVPKNQRRRAFSLRFMNENTTFAPREWKTSPDFSELNEKFKKGDKLNDSIFPILYDSNEINYF